MIPQDQIKPVELKYQYEFKPTELDKMKACTDAHGFAVVKKVISQGFVDELREAIKAALDPDDELQHG